MKYIWYFYRWLHRNSRSTISGHCTRSKNHEGLD